MELLIAQSIRRHRKALDLTQEQLAMALGVSPQSISKWECGDGYPDITMLPAIANYFKITVDELIGNDAIGQEEDRKKFHADYKKLYEADKSKELLELCCSYYRKYPDNFNYTARVGSVIAMYGMREELPLLREVCQKIIDGCTSPGYRQLAAKYMCLFCEDEELEQWLNLCAHSYSAFRGEVLEQRLWDLNKHDESRELYCINNLYLIMHFLTSRGRYWAKPDLSVTVNSQYRAFMECLGEGKSVPEGWLVPYALATLRLSAGYFGCEKKDEGYAMLEEALRLYEKWFSIPENTMLPLGSLFGGFTLRKHSGCVVSPSGKETRLKNGYFFHADADDPYRMMIWPKGWEWINSVRDEERFKAAVARAKTLCDAEKAQQQAEK